MSWRGRRDYSRGSANVNHDRSRRGVFSHQSNSLRVPVDQPPSPPLGPLKTELDVTDLVLSVDQTETPLMIRDCDYVASYNWVSGKNPIISTPGETQSIGIIAND